MRATMEDAIETAATKREDRRTRERVAMSERIAGSFPREREKKREGRERERERGGDRREEFANGSERSEERV